MGSSQFKHWASHTGGKVISGLLIGSGILILVLAQFYHGRVSRVVFVLGIFFVASGIVTTIFAFLADRGNGRHW